VLWSGLTVGVILLIQQFQSSKLSQQKSIIKISHSYFKINSTFKKWCDELVRLQIIERRFLPKSWKAIPRSLVSALEEYISLEENSSENSISDSMSEKKRRKKAKKKRKNSKTNISERVGSTALNFDPDEVIDVIFLDGFESRPNETRGNLFDPIVPSKSKSGVFTLGELGENEKLNKIAVEQEDTNFSQEAQCVPFEVPTPPISKNVINSCPASSQMRSKAYQIDSVAQPEAAPLFDISEPASKLQFDPPMSKNEGTLDGLVPSTCLSPFSDFEDVAL